MAQVRPGFWIGWQQAQGLTVMQNGFLNLAAGLESYA